MVAGPGVGRPAIGLFALNHHAGPQATARLVLVPRPGTDLDGVERLTRRTAP